MSVGLIVIYITVLGTISAKIEGWDTSPNTQYHIQTDEGPERYFKYQTTSGQYRREKRLQDGSVVGSYGWVDADGFLRLNDYVADNAGYRITKSKKVYVGSHSSVDNAVALANKVPAQAGTEVSNGYRSGYVNDVYRRPSFQPAEIGYPVISPSTFPSTVVTTVDSSTPAFDLDRSKILIFPSSSPVPITAKEYFRRRQPTPPDGYYPKSFTITTTTPNPLSRDEIDITPNVRYVSTTVRPTYDIYSHQQQRHQQQRYEESPLYKSANVGYNSEAEANRNAFYYDNKISDRIDFTPIRGDSTRNVVSSASGGGGVTGYSGDRTAPEYDGISVTRNGFRYFLPRHYHEEESSGDTRAGSFGYIDPFGIRRVIYYNSSPNSGFVHRKNNRYVGFDATPYDPRV